MVGAWNAQPDIDLVMHLGDLINAQWESYDVVLDDQVAEANPTRPEHSFGLGDRRSTYFEQQMQWARRVVADAWRSGEKVVMFEH